MTGAGTVRGRVSFAALALAIFVVVVGWPGPVAANPGGWVTAGQVAGEQVTSYDIEFRIGGDGVVHVEETIGYDFGANSKHGIFRELPYLEQVNGQRSRRYDISGITVSSPDGAPSQRQVTEEGDSKRIRIGDPQRTVSGRHTYVLGYTLDNALTSQNGHEELYWDAVGDAWEVPIGDLEVTVRAPAKITDAVCYVGASGSRARCDSATPSGERATFTQSRLPAGEGLTFAVRLPKGSVSVPPPVYTEDQGSSGGSGSSGGPLIRVPLAVQIALAVLVLALVPVVFLLARPGRAGGPGTGPQTTPPEGMRPGPAGALLAGRATAQHAVATLVDLAIRGYLRIDELDQGHDWGFARGRNPDADLTRYEWTLLSGLFRGRDAVRLSALRYRFAGTMSAVRREIIEDAVRNRWFRRRPDRQRPVLSVLGGAAMVFGWVFSSLFGWIVAGACFASGGAVLVMALTMTPITAAGAALRQRVQEFQRYLSADSVPSGAEGELRAAVATQLPYAIALGVAKGWAARFAAVATGPLSVDWYAGQSYPGDPSFATRFNSFTYQATSTMSATQSSTGSSGSSSSGFSSSGSSGGGGGGGGGGSW